MTNRDTEHTVSLALAGWIVVLRLNMRTWVDVRTAAFTVSWARQRVDEA